jgi:hypothetical protein
MSLTVGEIASIDDMELAPAVPETAQQFLRKTHGDSLPSPIMVGRADGRAVRVADTPVRTQRCDCVASR